MIVCSGMVCSRYKIECKKLNNTLVTVINDFLVTREVICQWFALMTSSLVKIIGKSPHSWPKNHYSRWLMHCSLYLGSLYSYTVRLGQDSHHLGTQHFGVHFCEWKVSNFKKNFTEMCHLRSNWQYDSIGLMAWFQTLSLSVAMLHWCIYASLGLNGLSQEVKSWNWFKVWH